MGLDLFRNYGKMQILILMKLNAWQKEMRMVILPDSGEQCLIYHIHSDHGKKTLVKDYIWQALSVLTMRRLLKAG